MPKNILVVDIGGTHVKVLASGEPNLVNLSRGLRCFRNLWLNDAALQALGSYKGGKMLFLGLGTGLGSTMTVDGIIEPMELGHLPYRNRTYEDYVGERGLERMGKNRWRRSVADLVARLIAALEPNDVVPGGNVGHLKELSAGCRAGEMRMRSLEDFGFGRAHGAVPAPPNREEVVKALCGASNP